MKKFNQVEDRKEKIKELEVLLLQLEGKVKATSEELTKLFNLHNYFNPKHPEYSKFCTSCVVRTYKNAKAIYEKVKNELC
jgi:hypothetical protein